MLVEKISLIQKKLVEQQVDWLLLCSLGHENNDALVTYLLTSAPENALILIPHQGQAQLYLTPFEVLEAQVKFPTLIVRPLNQSIQNIIKQEILSKQVIGIREQTLPVVVYKILDQANTICKPIEISEQWVAYKNPAEITAMRTVIAKTDTLFAELLRNWKTFTTEWDAAQFVTLFALQNKASLSFPPIIATGANAAEPHHHTNHTRFTKGFCVIDIGLEIDGYCSDLSRTLYLGEPSEVEKNKYQQVLASQTTAIEAIVPGQTAARLDQICRETLGELATYFIHGLGHGVGTAVHEWPGISAASKAVLAPGMIITIEPGIYQSGVLGIRIEDDMLVTESGYEILTHASRELTIIPLPV